MSKLQEIQADISQRIIELMETHGNEWTRQWVTPRMPMNGLTGHTYRGINTLVAGIWLIKNEQTKDPRFLTPNQIRQLGGHMKKGSKSIPLIFYKTYRDADTDEVTRRVMRYYRVFHLSDCEGIDQTRLVSLPENPDKTDAELCNEYELFFQNCGVTLTHNLSQPQYIPQLDQIDMPPITDFIGDEHYDPAHHYYSTLFHELTHATGAKHRMDRISLHEYGKSKATRAFEELIAEIGSAMIGMEVGLQPMPTEHNAAYVKSWLRALKDDPSHIFKATAEASKALQWCLAQQDSAEPSDQEEAA